MLSIDADGNNRSFARKTAWKALNLWNQLYFVWVLLASRPNTLISNFQGSKYSLFVSHISCFKPVDRIFYLFLIYKAIVIDLNFTILPIFSPAIFSQYLNLSQVPISLQLMACYLIKATLDDIILLSFFKSTLYNTKKPKWLKKEIASTLALTE